MAVFNIKRLIGRGKRLAAEHLSKPEPTPENVRITNETVAAQREEVLGSARKFIYPLGAPKHRVLKTSVAILIAALIFFFGFCLVDLYRQQDTSTFIYGVTEVVPFPVALVGNTQLVSYNDYLFELRHYMRYYQTQQQVDFNSKAGKQQLAVFKQRSLDLALQHAYVHRLAQENGISVSETDIDKAVALVRAQNRLGASDQVFASVLSEFWGWSVADFRRELREELLTQKVVGKLDADTHTRANNALKQLLGGADFAALAKQVSDDSNTRANGGEYPLAIDRSNMQLPADVMLALFSLQPGQYSTVINTGFSLEIVKVNQAQGSQVHASHIQFNFQPITTYIKPLEAQYPAHRFVKV